MGRFRMTAATTTGPASGPRPTSSTPTVGPLKGRPSGGRADLADHAARGIAQAWRPKSLQAFRHLTAQSTQMRQQGQERRFRGAGRTVLGLDGDAEAARRERRQIGALGTGLGDHVREERHQRGAAAAGAGDHVRLRAHRRPDADQRGLTDRRFPARVGEDRCGTGEAAQRQRVIGQAAAVDPGLGQPVEAGQGRDRTGAMALHGVLRQLVATGRCAQLQGRRQHPGMLARAVVVDAGRGRAGAQHGRGRRLVQGGVRAAGECRLIQAQAPEPGLDQGHMIRLAAMRGAGQRQLRGTDPERVGGTALDQGQGLEGLDRRARVDGLVDVAQGQQHATVRIGHARPHPMPAFDPLAAPHLDCNRCRRHLPPSRHGGG